MAGAEIANRFDTSVIVLHACQQAREEARIPGSTKVVDRLRQNGERLLGQARHLLWKQGVAGAEFIYLPDKPVAAILKTCHKRQPDLLVMGSRGLSGVESVVLGSVSARVSRRAPCSVLIVR